MHRFYDFSSWDFEFPKCSNGKTVVIRRSTSFRLIYLRHSKSVETLCDDRAFSVNLMKKMQNENFRAQIKLCLHPSRKSLQLRTFHAQNKSKFLCLDVREAPKRFASLDRNGFWDLFGFNVLRLRRNFKVSKPKKKSSSNFSYELNFQLLEMLNGAYPWIKNIPLTVFPLEDSSTRKHFTFAPVRQR